MAKLPPSARVETRMDSAWRHRAGGHGAGRVEERSAGVKGLPYQTYMKMLLHQALEKERRAS
jgi:hypothetical protein